MIAGSYGRSIFIWYEMIKLSSKVSVPFSIPISNVQKFLLLHILISIWCCQCSEFWHSKKYVVVSYCCFNLYFSDNIDVKHLFICLFSTCTFSLVMCLLKILAYLLIFFSHCSILIVFCIFWITVFYQMCLLLIVSPRLWLILSFL